jgi:LAO/AO transport system kinase
MVDFFLLLMLANAGDELQGIKRGIIEMADAVVITKADGASKQAAQVAKVTYQQAIHLYPLWQKKWQPQVLTCSSVTNEGIVEIWNLIEKYVEQMHKDGFFTRNRQMQNIDAIHETIKQLLEEQFYNSPAVKALLPQIEKSVKEGHLPALSAAMQLLHAFKNP